MPPSLPELLPQLTHRHASAPMVVVVPCPLEHLLLSPSPWSRDSVGAKAGQEAAGHKAFKNETKHLIPPPLCIFCSLETLDDRFIYF